MKEIFVTTDNRGNAWGAFTVEADANKFANEVAGKRVDVIKVLLDPLTSQQMDTLKPFMVRCDSDGDIYVALERESAGLAAHNDRHVAVSRLTIYLFAASHFEAVSQVRADIETWLASLPQEKAE